MQCILCAGINVLVLWRMAYHLYNVILSHHFSTNPCQALGRPQCQEMGMKKPATRTG